MDEKAIRAKAEQLAGIVCTTFDCDDNSHEAHINRIQAALTEVGDEQWDAAVEAAAQQVTEKMGWGMEVEDAIRRLKRSKA